MGLVIENPRSLKDWVGREIGASDWFAVSQERIRHFANTTEDRQWIHVDAEGAQQDSPYGATIAHGFLTLSLLSHLLKQAVRIKNGARMSVNYGLNRVRFPAPVRAGSTVRGRFTLQSANELPDALEAVFEATIEVEGSEKPCCVAEWVIRYYF